MGDADIIPIGSSGRPGRGTGKRPSAAARDLAPRARTPRRRSEADSAGDQQPDQSRDQQSPPEPSAAEQPPGEQPTTPPPEPAASSATQADVDQSDGATGRPDAPAVVAVPDLVVATTRERGPWAGVPVGDWLSAAQQSAAELWGEQWEPQLARMLAFWRRRVTGEYVIDDFGFDEELTTKFLLGILRPIAQKWFRVEVRGVENIPTDGGALVVSNHSGTIPVDGLMTMVSVHDATGRNLRALGADLVFRMPFISSLARKSGATLACHEDAERMLRGGELVGVWPEGFKGIGKPYSERYKLQRFGRGGFVSAALRTGVPIVPLAVVGAEEIYPLVGNVPAIARLLGLPYLPITPFFPLLGPLGMVPLPSKWMLEFGEPIRTDTYDSAAGDDPMLVFNVTDQVRETIQQTLYSLLIQRESVFG